VKSIGTRIAAWYATAATATLALLFIAGYLLLEKQLVHGLVLLVECEFREIDTRLGPDYRKQGPDEIENRIREITDYASTLFYIDMHILRTPFCRDQIKTFGQRRIGCESVYSWELDDCAPLVCARSGTSLAASAEVAIPSRRTHSVHTRGRAAFGSGQPRPDGKRHYRCNG